MIIFPASCKENIGKINKMKSKLKQSKIASLKSQEIVLKSKSSLDKKCKAVVALKISFSIRPLK